MKPTAAQINESILTMREMIPFFPASARAELLLTVEISTMVATVEQLDWLTLTACRAIPKWEGIPQLRGLFCSKYKPADGTELPCTVPGYTAKDGERAYIDRVAAETERELRAAREQRKLHGDVAAFEAPIVPKKLPMPENPRARQRLADTMQQTLPEATAISIPGTPKRTDEENRKLREQIEADIAARRKA